MIVIDTINQGDPEWYELRKGRPSASKAACILTSTSKVSKQREKYLYTLAGQRVSGRIEESYRNSHMDRGSENEEMSRSHFEFTHDVDITQVAVVYPDEEKKYLCSPDGLIYEWEEGFETKDAIFSVQIARLKANKPDPEHFCQMQMSLLICGYDYWNYQSFCENLPPLTLKVGRDKEYISSLRQELDRFCDELDKLTKWLKEYKC